MIPTPAKSYHPVFEANQVLSNRHLNQVFDYLDEQERLTRANLIGIGIVCGLEIKLAGTQAAPEVHISKGCGITSEGYLIIEPGELTLTSYKSYTPPTDVPYPILNPPLPILEMFEAGTPGTIPFGSHFLDDKVVVLFLELKKESLRNCNPGNCDDKGAEVITRVRRLLINKNNHRRLIRLLDGTIQVANETLDDYERIVMRDLNLPDIRLPRYNVLAGPLTSSNMVLSAFFTALHTDNLFVELKRAFSNLYTAFLPVVKAAYPSDPFSQFDATYGFLNNAPATTTQVGFLQYYYDHVDDLIKAYDELRWKGVDLMCACCPPSGLFPRHLVLGMAEPTTENNPDVYRHHFQASAAVSKCEQETEELLVLFRRLVEMIERFTNTPPMPTFRSHSGIDPQIRLTPSKLGDVPVSAKCIPYYYLQNGTPALFRLWNPVMTRRHRAAKNLSYRAEEYAGSDEHAINPLLYDLEPNNFLRIEGHLGKHWKGVMDNLINLRNQYRLPIEFIALRTGAFDERMEIDLTAEYSRFEDLESLYDATREQWLGALCNELINLYGLESDMDPDPVRVFSVSKTVFIQKYAPLFRVDSQKLGGIFEMSIQINIFSNTVKSVRDNSDFELAFFEIFRLMLTLAESLPQELKAFNYSILQNRFKALHTFVVAFEKRLERIKEQHGQRDQAARIGWEEIDDRLESVLYNLHTETFKAIYDEYLRRIKEIKKRQFLTDFLIRHPGIQHKAGVPMGGTFIVVYHEKSARVGLTPVSAEVIDEKVENETVLKPVQEADFQNRALSEETQAVSPLSTASKQLIYRLQANPLVAHNADFNALVNIWREELIEMDITDETLPPNANQSIANFLKDLPYGTVIADFYLPYLCSQHRDGIQFVLPETSPVNPSPGTHKEDKEDHGSTKVDKKDTDTTKTEEKKSEGADSKNKVVETDTRKARINKQVKVTATTAKVKPKPKPVPKKPKPKDKK